MNHFSPHTLKEASEVTVFKVQQGVGQLSTPYTGCNPLLAHSSSLESFTLWPSNATLLAIVRAHEPLRDHCK